MGTYNKKYKGTRTGLTPGPSDREGVETATRAMEGMKARYLNTTKVEPDGMGKDSTEAIKEFLGKYKE